MVFLEYLLYAVCLVIGYLTFRYTWWVYPKKISRWKRNRTSEYDFMYNRILDSICAGLVAAGFGIYIVYTFAHRKSILEDNESGKVTLVSENKGLIKEADEPSDDHSADIPDVTAYKTSVEKQILKLWDSAHNQQDYALFDSLYMDYVLFYGQELKKAQCIDNKKKLFAEYQDFSQHSKNIRCKKLDIDLIKLIFDKHVNYNGKSQVYSSFIVLKSVGKSWKIEQESDFTTERNLKRNK